MYISSLIAFLQLSSINKKWNKKKEKEINKTKLVSPIYNHDDDDNNKQLND
jgi:hypothetical protein